jgi:hypothetical protein
MSGHDGIGRIGRRETMMDLRVERPQANVPERVPVENGGIVPPRAEVPAEAAPLPADGFAPEVLPDVTSSLYGEGPQLTKGMLNLVPDLSRMNELGQLPERFAADMALLRAQLGVPGVPRQEDADQLFQFFVKYAERFVEMATAVEAHAGTSNDGDPNAGDGAAKGQGKDGLPKPTRSGEVPVAEGGLFAGESFGEEMPLRAGMWTESAGRPEVPEFAAPTQPASPKEIQDGIQRFTRALGDAGFNQLADARTGQEGAKAAAKLLEAQSPRELKDQAARIDLRPLQQPPTDARPNNVRAELAAQQQLPSDQARQAAAQNNRANDLSRPVSVDGRPELRVVPGQNGAKVQSWAVAAGQVVVRADAKPDRPEEGFADRLRGSSKRLSARMFWNVLHTFRGKNEDSTVFQGEWDKLTFGALLLLVGVALAVIALVSL